MADAGHSELPTRIALGVIDTWRRLGFEQRIAAVGALLLIVSTFGPFSFVEGAIVLIGFAVLLLLRSRASGREFHVPFGDGTMIATAGVWSAVLILVRLFNRPLGQGMLALVCAAILIVAGLRERAKRLPDDLPSDPAHHQRGADALAGRDLAADETLATESLPRRAPQAATRRAARVGAPEREALEEDIVRTPAPGHQQELFQEPLAEPSRARAQVDQSPAELDRSDPAGEPATERLPATDVDALTESLGEPPEFEPPTRRQSRLTRRRRRL